MNFCIFSYNRPLHLENCLQSIESLCPAAKVFIFDDNSQCKETQAILTAAKERHNVINTTLDTPDNQHGGLYANMQLALKTLPEDELACFIQDDLQVVRPIEATDISDITQYFESCLLYTSDAADD